MQTPPAHHARFDARFAIAVHRVAYGRDPRRVEVGLMAARSLDDAGIARQLDGVSIVVGSLEDRTTAVRA